MESIPARFVITFTLSESLTYAQWQEVLDPLRAAFAKLSCIGEPKVTLHCPDIWP